MDKKRKNVSVAVVTSKLADEERKMKIDEVVRSEFHVLVCTDCLSEGVNLQQGFEAVIHYDLPWNPNRMEQRNGRIDRFGQTSDKVLISTLHSKNNIVDDYVLNVLYKRQNEIRKRLGVYLPIAENDSSLMETIMHRILVTQHNRQEKHVQLSLFDEDEDKEWLDRQEKEKEIQIKRMEENEKKSHTYFAHNTQQLDPTKLTDILTEAKEVTGGVEDTRDYVINLLKNANVSINNDKPLCYSFNILGLNNSLQHYFDNNRTKNGIVRISFASPTPKNYMYIGRNHTFVEETSRSVINDTVNKNNNSNNTLNSNQVGACRAMVMETTEVDIITTVLLMRVRSVICDKKDAKRELVGEEMLFFGYRGSIDDNDLISQEEAKHLFLDAKASGSLNIYEQKTLLSQAINWIYDEKELRKHTDSLALERAQNLAKAFTTYRTYLKSPEYTVVKPVLPMDVIAAYHFVPHKKS